MEQSVELHIMTTSTNEPEQKYDVDHGEETKQMAMDELQHPSALKMLYSYTDAEKNEQTITKRIEDIANQIKKENNNDEKYKLYAEKYNLDKLKGDYYAAYEDAECMIELDPNKSAGYIKAAHMIVLKKEKANYKMKSFKEMESFYQKALEKCENEEENAKLETEKSKVPLIKEAYENVFEANQIYEKCYLLAISPGHTTIFKQLGRCCSCSACCKSKTVEMELAIKKFELAIKAFESPIFYWNLCLSYVVMGDYDEAEKQITKYIAERPTDSCGYIKKVNILNVTKKRYFESTKVYDTAESYRDYAFAPQRYQLLQKYIYDIERQYNEDWTIFLIVFVTVILTWIALLNYEFATISAFIFAVLHIVSFYVVAAAAIVVLFERRSIICDRWSIWGSIKIYQAKTNLLYLAGDGIYIYFYVASNFFWVVSLIFGLSKKLFSDDCDFAEKLFDRKLCLFRISFIQNLVIYTVVILIISISIITQVDNFHLYKFKKKQAQKMLKQNDHETFGLIKDVMKHNYGMMIMKQCCHGNNGKCKCNATTIFGCFAFLMSLVMPCLPWILYLSRKPSSFGSDVEGVQLIILMNLITFTGLCLLFTTLYRIVYRFYQMSEVMRLLSKPINVKKVKDVKDWWSLRQYVLKWELPLIYEYCDYAVATIFITTIVLTIWMLIEIFITNVDENGITTFFETLSSRPVTATWVLFTPIAIVSSWVTFSALMKPYNEQKRHIKMLQQELLTLNLEYELIEYTNADTIKTGETAVIEALKCIEALKSVIQFCSDNPAVPKVLGSDLRGGSLTLFKGYLLTILIAFISKLLVSDFK